MVRLRSFNRSTASFTASKGTRNHSRGTLGFGLMSGARDVGLTPGKDIAIVGFDDVRASAVRNVPLTTVSTPPARSGAELARLLRARIKDGGAAAVNIIPPPRLIIRKSCGAPAAGITRKN